MRILADAGAPPEAVLFLDDGADIPESESRIIFLPESSRGFGSLPAALPQGKYRLKTTAGGTVTWSSFRVEPRSLRPGCRIIRISPVPAPHTLEINLTVHDIDTGWDLGGSAELEVFRDNGFIPVSEAGPLLSGQVYSFRISAPGYLPEEHILRINGNETQLHFQTELEADKDKRK